MVLKAEGLGRYNKGVNDVTLALIYKRKFLLYKNIVYYKNLYNEFNEY